MTLKILLLIEKNDHLTVLNISKNIYHVLYLIIDIVIELNFLFITASNY